MASYSQNSQIQMSSGFGGLWRFWFSVCRRLALAARTSSLAARLRDFFIEGFGWPCAAFEVLEGPLESIACPLGAADPAMLAWVPCEVFREPSPRCVPWIGIDIAPLRSEPGQLTVPGTWDSQVNVNWGEAGLLPLADCCCWWRRLMFSWPWCEVNFSALAMALEIIPVFSP